jgi:beta-glucosidase
MSLPPNSDTLISAVVAANANTAIVIQSGTPVSMPWLRSAPALLPAWYGGNETGNAIADVLFGMVNPSAKLPLSFPLRNEDNPAFLHYRSERGRTRYAEDVYVGYRFYEKTATAVAFPFGHGLSYTRFAMGDLAVADDGPDAIAVRVAVSNTGAVAGAHVVQVYVVPQTPSVHRPVKELKGFVKLALRPGETRTATVRVSRKYAASFWDEERDAWVMEKGRYDVLVGDSSANTPLKGAFDVAETAWWRGL